jgi:cyclopropane-fatty-acyl-phospholipid synthase
MAGVIATGISPADNQINLARQKSEGLGITFIQQDYRDLEGEFDRIVTVGMMLHHTISSNLSKHVTDPFFDRYIFPGGVLPSLAGNSALR